jgi:DNA-binding GntR family transcriptional regulator
MPNSDAYERIRAYKASKVNSGKKSGQVAAVVSKHAAELAAIRADVQKDMDAFVDALRSGDTDAAEKHIKDMVKATRKVSDVRTFLEVVVMSAGVIAVRMREKGDTK